MNKQELGELLLAASIETAMGGAVGAAAADPERRMEGAAAGALAGLGAMPLRALGAIPLNYIQNNALRHALFRGLDASTLALPALASRAVMAQPNTKEAGVASHISNLLNEAAPNALIGAASADPGERLRGAGIGALTTLPAVLLDAAGYRTPSLLFSLASLPLSAYLSRLSMPEKTAAMKNKNPDSPAAQAVIGALAGKALLGTPGLGAAFGAYQGYKENPYTASVMAGLGASGGDALAGQLAASLLPELRTPLRYAGSALGAVAGAEGLRSLLDYLNIRESNREYEQAQKHGSLKTAAHRASGELDAFSKLGMDWTSIARRSGAGALGSSALGALVGGLSSPEDRMHGALRGAAAGGLVGGVSGAAGEALAQHLGIDTPAYYKAIADHAAALENPYLDDATIVALGDKIITPEVRRAEMFQDRLKALQAIGSGIAAHQIQPKEEKVASAAATALNWGRAGRAALRGAAGSGALGAATGAITAGEGHRMEGAVRGGLAGAALGAATGAGTNIYAQRSPNMQNLRELRAAREGVLRGDAANNPELLNAAMRRINTGSKFQAGRGLENRLNAMQYGGGTAAGLAGGYLAN